MLECPIYHGLGHDAWSRCAYGKIDDIGFDLLPSTDSHPHGIKHNEALGDNVCSGEKQGEMCKEAECRVGRYRRIRKTMRKTRANEAVSDRERSGGGKGKLSTAVECARRVLV